MKQDKTESKKELKKHAATIHCSNTLSLLQRKITNALLYHAYKELMSKEEHEITVKQLCRLMGYQGNNHGVIKEALKGLISTVIEWNVINDETGAENWTASSMLASVSLEGPLCFYAYSPRMKQLLYSPSMFGKIDLVIQSHFRSSYGLALYENCTRYRGLPHTKWFEIELFKKLMGVPAGKYEVFRDFKRRVLDKAIEEVNGYSDLVIASEVVREGRRVVRLRFKLKERAKKTRLGSKKAAVEIIQDQGPATISLETKLLNTFCLTEEQVKQLLLQHDSQFILEKIDLIENSKLYQEGGIQNMAGYLLSAIKNNYRPVPAKPAVIEGEQKTKEEQEWVELVNEIEQIRSEYAHYRETTIQNTITTLPHLERLRFMENFYQFAGPMIEMILQLQHHRYTRETILESPQVKALLRQFAVRELDLLNVCSLEEFVAQLDEDKIEKWHQLKSYDPDHTLLRFRD